RRFHGPVRSRDVRGGERRHPAAQNGCLQRRHALQGRSGRRGAGQSHLQRRLERRRRHPRRRQDRKGRRPVHDPRSQASQRWQGAVSGVKERRRVAANVGKRKRAMDTHLEVHEWLGCQEKSGRVPAPNLRPVAMEPKSARVVWGERVVTRMTAPFKAKGVFTNLAPYDSELYRARRMLAETVLGYLVTQPESNRYVVAAVRRVSANILK